MMRSKPEIPAILEDREEEQEEEEEEEEGQEETEEERQDKIDEEKGYGGIWGDNTAPFSQIHCLQKNGYRPTDGPTDGQSLLQRYVDASENEPTNVVACMRLEINFRFSNNLYSKKH